MPNCERLSARSNNCFVFGEQPGLRALSAGANNAPIEPHASLLARFRSYRFSIVHVPRDCLVFFRAIQSQQKHMLLFTATLSHGPRHGRGTEFDPGPWAWFYRKGNHAFRLTSTARTRLNAASIFKPVRSTPALWNGGNGGMVSYQSYDLS